VDSNEGDPATSSADMDIENLLPALSYRCLVPKCQKIVQVCQEPITYPLFSCFFQGPTYLKKIWVKEEVFKNSIGEGGG
jgi:hypothetical protein